MTHLLHKSGTGASPARRMRYGRWIKIYLTVVIQAAHIVPPAWLLCGCVGLETGFDQLKGFGLTFAHCVRHWQLRQNRDVDVSKAGRSEICVGDL